MPCLGTLKWFAVWCAGLTTCGVLAVAVFAFDLNPFVGGLLGGVVGVATIVCLCAMLMLCSSYFHWSGVHRQFLQHDAPQIRRTLDNGRVAVKSVRAVAVVQLVEFEDEGSGYIFDLADGQLLFLKGQQFFPVSDDMAWPSSRFEIVRSEIDGRWIGIFCYGPELSPIRTVELQLCKDDIVWDEREEVVVADLHSFVSSLLAV